MVKLETSLWYSGIFLKALSFSLTSPNASSLQKAANLAHFFFVIITATTMFVQILIYIIQNSTSSQFVMEHISTQVAFLQLISKVAMYRIHHEKFAKLSNFMNDMVQNGSTQLKRHLQECTNIGNVVYLVYTSTVLLMASDYCVMPFFRPERDLPIAAWYPFDYKKSSLLYCIAYFHQISAITMSWLCSGVDVMFGILVFGCCARYKMMQEMLRVLNKPDSEKLPLKPGDKAGRKSAMEFDKKIGDLMDLHCEVIDSVKDINDIHTYILFVLFLTSVIMICCAGFQVTNVSKQSMNSRFIFASIVCCVLIELLFYFVPGDMLVNEGNAVGVAAYNSDWESMPPRYRKCILLIILRSGRPQQLKGARVKPLILKNYASFLATTVSYFTSLQAAAGVD